MRVLVVDGANVVGSRPDGWWRDRAGAAARLHDRLSGADLPYDGVVLVLEGAARSADVVEDSRVQVVRASGSGDDAIVEVVRERALAGSSVELVTADRGLRARVEQLGAHCVGPSWLLDEL